MNEILTLQELQDKILYSLDIVEFLDLLGMSQREAMCVLLQSATEEQREQVEQYFLSC